MKFANLTLDSAKEVENIGDWVQIFAIENLYHYMNINYEDVIRISISELNTYDGEYVVLPINFPVYGYYNLSPKIIPVFLGISVVSGDVSLGLRMQQYQPIGCRDYHTLLEMRKQGLDAYYGGCLTIALPERSSTITGKKVFIVDVSDDILKHIPDDIKNGAEFVTHVYYNDDKKGERGAREIYKRYEQEASMVITSRIHCAQPCIAAGIPVIFICETISHRYEVLRHFIPVYTLNKMDEINWEPSKVSLESFKLSLLQNAAERINQTLHKYKNMLQISEFYLSGEPLPYSVDTVWAFQKYIAEKYEKNDEFAFILWGETQIAEKIYSWISENYPYACMEYIIDMFSKKKFHGYDPINDISILDTWKDTPIFVTAGNANDTARKMFEKYGITKYVLCYNGLYMVDGEKKSYL